MTEKDKLSLEVSTKCPGDWVDVSETKERGFLCNLLGILDTKFIENIMRSKKFLGEWVSKQVYQIPN